MGWRQLYDKKHNQSQLYANADLHHGPVDQTDKPPRLLAYPWSVDDDPLVKVELLRTRNISTAFGSHLDLHALVDPTFPCNLVSRMLAEKLDPTFYPVIGVTYTDAFGHRIPVMGEIQATPLFWGDDPKALGQLEPSIYDEVGAVPWAVLADGIAPHEDFVLIGRGLMHRLVTVFSRGWTFIGVDDDR